jgi:hypothetical protein
MTEPLNQHHDVAMGSERSFGFVFAAVFAVVALWPLVHGNAPRLWVGAIALAFLVVAFVRPKLLRPLNVVWFRFGLLLGAIMTPVVMALLYITTVIPTGLILRLRGKDLLGLKRDPKRASYWITREPGPAPGSMKRQF